MSNRRLLGFAWLVATVLVAVVLGDFFDWALGAVDIANPRWLSVFSLADLIGVAASVVAAVVLWKRAEVQSFCIEAVEETRQVVWPTKQETRDNTVVVVATSILMALILGVFDLIWAKFTSFLLYSGA
jgi:preprotein translocase subunit SecE